MKSVQARPVFWLTTVASLLALLLGHSPAIADTDSNNNQALARKLRAAGEILPLEQIVAQAQAAKSGELLETELESKHGRYIYEVEILDAAGQVWELKLDARTAKLLQMERDD